jgi:hypothetical protein
MLFSASNEVNLPASKFTAPDRLCKNLRFPRELFRFSTSYEIEDLEPGAARTEGVRFWDERIPQASSSSILGGQES